MRRPTRWIACCTTALCATAALADPPPNTELNGDPVETGVYRAWAGNYRSIARYCGEMGEGFLVVPGFDRRVPSSRGMTVAQARDELTETWRETNNGIAENRMREPAPEEAAAYATVLPSLEIGDYGYVASVEVVAILGPEEMLVKDLWLIDLDAVGAEYERDEERARAAGARNYRDALEKLYEQRLAVKEMQEDAEDILEATHRLVGYETRAVIVGERWAGPEREGFQVALARWETPEQPEAEEGDSEDDGRRSRRRRGRRADDPRLLLINPEPVLRRPLDERAMVRLLDARGYTIAEYVELMRVVRERTGRDRDAADDLLTRALLPPTPDEEEQE